MLYETLLQLQMYGLNQWFNVFEYQGTVGRENALLKELNEAGSIITGMLTRTP